MLKTLLRCLALAPILFACNPALVPPENPAAEDLRYLAARVRQVHPALGDAARRQAFDQLADSLAAAARPGATQTELYGLASRLLVSLGDAHTWVMPPAGGRNLPLRLFWASDGLVVLASGAPGVRPGDEVLAVAALTPAQLLERLRTVVPAENDGHVREFGALLLPRAAVLGALGLVNSDGTVSLELRRADGTAVRGEVPLSDGAPQVPSRHWFGWKIEATYGLFWLDACDLTPEYQRAVEEFFAAVKQAGLSRVALDVRRNGGGDSQVLNTLLAYLPADGVRVFHRPGGPAQQAVPHPSPGLVFGGDLYVLVGPYTFSSANWIAGVIHDNRLGRLVGQPTGNAPTSYGNIARFTTPYLGLSFSVSKDQWVRPDPSLDPADALAPHVAVPTSVADVRAGRDPVLAWLADPK